MPDAPTELDGAKVVLWSHLLGESGRAAGVAVCQYTDEDGFYVFWCDAYWKVISDTSHHSVDDATDAIF